MVHRRQVSWGRAAGEMRRQWRERPDIREERMRVDDRMVAWRGLSGRRYAFTRAPIDATPSLPEVGVVAAVRHADGVSTLVSVAPAMGPEAFEDWRRDAEDADANEVQVHALLRHPDEALDLVEDLGFEPQPYASYGLGF